MVVAGGGRGSLNGGERIADVLVRQGVSTLFALCGGHISPILVAAAARGLRVVDVRDEKNAVFAADATSRLTGTVGVAAVTAGPGVTNTITALKNAQLAQSPLVLLGGASATVLRGRGSLQDIDQMALVRPHVKAAYPVTSLRAVVPTLERAFRVAADGVPGPVFVELPVDLLYDQATVRDLYGAKAASQVRGPAELAVQAYLRLHLARVFAGSARHAPARRLAPRAPLATREQLDVLAAEISAARRPVLVLGSQVAARPEPLPAVADAVGRLGLPTYLSGTARGLLGREHPLWLRHKRGQALKEADLVLLCGVPCDFRLGYGRGFGAGTRVAAVNLSERDARLNRRPELEVIADPGDLLRRLADRLGPVVDPDPARVAHLARLRERDSLREKEIVEQGAVSGEFVNPVRACLEIEAALDDDSVLVADGGDFVGTASYVVSPRGPGRWLDPGVFGTLGVGAGFAMGAKVARPDAEVWILYGDGSVGFSIAEFDTFVRHGLPVIAVVGNDAGWTQIARDQVGVLGSDVGTVLARTDYDRVAEGFGAAGLTARTDAEVAPVLAEARRLARSGRPVLVNLHLGRSTFREGSISL